MYVHHYGHSKISPKRKSIPKRSPRRLVTAACISVNTTPNAIAHVVPSFGISSSINVQPIVCVLCQVLSHFFVSFQLKFTENCRLLHRMYRNLPFSFKETAIWNTLKVWAGFSCRQHVLLSFSIFCSNRVLTQSS